MQLSILNCMDLPLSFLFQRNICTYFDKMILSGITPFRAHEQFGICQAGTSLAILKDGTALMGSPGPYTWRGTVFVQSIVGSYLDRDKNVYLGPLEDTPEPIDKYSYLGVFCLRIIY